MDPAVTKQLDRNASEYHRNGDEEDLRPTLKHLSDLLTVHSVKGTTGMSSMVFGHICILL